MRHGQFAPDSSLVQCFQKAGKTLGMLAEVLGSHDPWSQSEEPKVAAFGSNFAPLGNFHGREMDTALGAVVTDGPVLGRGVARTLQLCNEPCEPADCDWCGRLPNHNTRIIFTNTRYLQQRRSQHSNPMAHRPERQNGPTDPASLHHASPMPPTMLRLHISTSSGLCTEVAYWYTGCVYCIAASSLDAIPCASSIPSL